MENKRYKTIYADPPWPITNASKVLYKSDKPIASKYPTMDIDSIAKLPVSKLADVECSLFLWTTHTFLHQALHVMECWGFKYHCCITWDKGSGFSIWGFHRRTELCLYGYRGSINLKQSGRFIPTLISEKKKRHSQKPETMYQLLEQNAQAPRVELFARATRLGWDSWGNEVESEIELISGEE